MFSINKGWKNYLSRVQVSRLGGKESQFSAQGTIGGKKCLSPIDFQLAGMK